jgi:flagellin FlaB
MIIMKYTKLNYEEEENDLAAIGIGAMIVFIALILVAAVASAVIIQTGEKLQQNAQQTGDDTQREIGGKITINSAYIKDADELRLYFESAPGSGTLATADIAWQIACTNLDPDGDGTPSEAAEPFGYQFTASSFGDGNAADNPQAGDTFQMDDPDSNDAVAPDNSVVSITPGEAYVIDITVDGGAVGGGDDCTFSEVGINGQLTLWVHVEGGGSTYEVIVITDTAVGSLLI